jgi:dsRNA-specific ribonuclease
MTVGPLAFTEDITARARWAQDHNDGLPKWEWSTGERLAVSVILGDAAYLRGAGYSMAEAKRRLAGDLLGADVETWLGAVREELSR